MSEKLLRGLKLIDRDAVARCLEAAEEVTADALTLGERHQATAVGIDERCAVGIEDAAGVARDGCVAVPGAKVGTVGMGSGWYGHRKEGSRGENAKDSGQSTHDVPFLGQLIHWKVS
ncbi:hypothetical protein ABZ153_39895 [Streptomyces sp. NPDC006290]|uniref:hypothetical protein n=1 Tax=Streptomyces sp. NPDC006290 TaxID=3156745 RepID=UPI00339DCB6F